jgi:hypothetical protein
MAEVKYAKWLDELLERGFYLSEFKRLVQEKFPGENIDLWRFLHRRRKQGWKIERRREGNDTFYRVVEKPVRVRVEDVGDRVVDEGLGEGGEVRGDRVLCGVGMYVLKEEGGVKHMRVVVGSDSWDVQLKGRGVEEVLRELLRCEVEIKKVERVGDEEKGVFGLYQVV